MLPGGPDLRAADACASAAGDRDADPKASRASTPPSAVTRHGRDRGRNGLSFGAAARGRPGDDPAPGADHPRCEGGSGSCALTSNELTRNVEDRWQQVETTGHLRRAIPGPYAQASLTGPARAFPRLYLHDSICVGPCAQPARVRRAGPAGAVSVCPKAGLGPGSPVGRRVRAFVGRRGKQLRIQPPPASAPSRRPGPGAAAAAAAAALRRGPRRPPGRSWEGATATATAAATAAGRRRVGPGGGGRGSRGGRA